MPENHYEAEQLQSAEEQYLAAYCLFQDVSRIRASLGATWKNYQEGGIDLVAASITTNTAIDLVRSIEQDCLQHFANDADYKSIMKIFYTAQCLQRGRDPNSRQVPNDPVDFEVYELVELVMLPTYIALEGLQRAIIPGQALLQKPGHFGTRDTSTDWNEKSNRDKVQDDRIVLMEALSHIHFFSIITSRWTLTEDELVRGVRQMAPGNGIPLWLVFAA